MLKIEHLSKNYGDKKAVDDLNLHIAPGEIYGFILTVNPSGHSRWNANAVLLTFPIILICMIT